VRRHVLIAVLLLSLTACQPAPPAAEQPLPTLASLAVAPELEGAASTAINFLESWRLGDYSAMYALLSFASQEATPLEAFTATYTSVADTMTLTGLTVSGNTLYRDPSRDDVAAFSYNVDFQTRMLGDFSDNDRLLQLLYDPGIELWRVAWSAGDIFPELAGGGQMQLQISIPSRANIYDRHDQILAGQSGRIVTISAVKNQIADWNTCLALLAPATGRDPATLQSVYDESANDWLMEMGTLEVAVYEQSHVALENTCAAQFSSRPTRLYERGTVAPNIVGAVGYPNPDDLSAIEAAGFNSDSILGQSGIERSWDDRLRGHPGGKLLIVNSSGDVLREVARSISRPPESVWLTIDADMQEAILKIFDRYYSNYQLEGRGSKGASAVILDVQTGEILAMVSYPTYDINVFAPFPKMGRAAAQKLMEQLQTDPRIPLLNRPTQGTYPLGSVMKTASAIAVADSGVYALDQRYTCSGVWTRDITRYDWLPGGHGTVTLPSALTQSCNPYFYEVGYQLNEFNPETLPAYAKRLGLGQPTGLTDLPEDPGLIPDPEWKRVNTGIEWTFSDAVNMSIGQGELSVTPLQVTRMFAAIANGGTLYRPQLVRQAGILGEAPSYTLTPDAMATIDIRPEVLDVVRNSLCDVTTLAYGTAEFQFKLDPELQNIGVCGKTGTAQNRPDLATHAWFAAYAPRENPQIAIVVMAEHSGEGSGVAAPIVRDILHYYFFDRKP
jgi:penicillin-binding protein 2